MSSMLARPKWVFLLLAGAFVVPYALLDKDLSARVNRALGREKTPDSTADSGQATASVASPTVSPVAATPSPSPLCDLDTALRFDVSPHWVAATWPNVTTVVADPRYAGMRVPLVTGVMPDDVAGTLTYYYDEKQRVMRITLSGTTNDPRRLVALVTSQYRLTSQPTLDAGLYQSKWNGKAISTLHVRHASAVTGASHGKFAMQLDLNRADAFAGTARLPQRLFGW